MDINERTTREWRELGFYYDYNEANQQWMIRGSRSALLKFAEHIHLFSENPKYSSVSEEEHIGPYMYLKLMTWNRPEITSNYWAGTSSDLKKLAKLISVGAQSHAIGASFNIGPEYSGESVTSIQFFIEDDDFDAASADPQLTKFRN